MSVKIIKSPREMQIEIDELRKHGKKIGLVPTMGYLHEGHLSLVKKSTELADVTVVSIFVNPTQFAPNEDLTKYPRDFVRDRELLIRNKTDIIFYPEPEDIYTEGFQTYVNTTEITKRLEGASRPTHFRGVTTVVSILFNIIKPHYAFFGQKDAQQAAVIKRMVTDLHIDVNIYVEPIVRENDGLAMSSRNIYLSPSERQDALVLFNSLNHAELMIRNNVFDGSQIVNEMEKIIGSVSSSSLDYVKIVEDENFEEADVLQKGKNYFILIACRIGATRLIDNMHITA